MKTWRAKFSPSRTPWLAYRGPMVCRSTVGGNGRTPVGGNGRRPANRSKARELYLLNHANTFIEEAEYNQLSTNIIQHKCQN